MPGFFGFSPYASSRCGSRSRSLRRSAQILFRPARLFAQRGRRVHRPIGIAQHGARQENKIGLAFRNDGVGLRRLGDESNRRRGNACLASNSRGKFNLKAGSCRNLRVRHKSARGCIDKIDAVLAQLFRKLHRFVGVPAAIRPVGGGDAYKQRQAIRPHAANRIRHFQHQADAIVEAAAVSVRAMIRERRQKLMQQVAMRRVNLNEIEARLECPARGLAKALDNGLDSGFIERHRHGIIGRKCDRAGRNRLPSALGGS